VPNEILTDRDAVFCIGQTSDGRAILAPEWVDLCQVLEVVPRACRPYRAKTKGKVERLVREVKERFLAGLGGKACLLPPRRLTTTGWRSSGATSSSCRAATAPPARSLPPPGRRSGPCCVRCRIDCSRRQPSPRAPQPVAIRVHGAWASTYRPAT